MTQAVDLLLQEAIVLGLAALAEDRRAIEELIGRRDALRHNSSDEWREALRAVVRELATPSSPNYVPVLLGYPSPGGAARLPAVAIVKATGGENPAELAVGDVLDHRVEVIGTGEASTAIETTTYGGGATTTVQITTWADAPELSAVIHAAVAWALQNQKQRLQDLGVHELSWSDGGVQSDLDPRVAYVPLLSCTVGWTQQQSHRRKVPNRIRFLNPTVQGPLSVPTATPDTTPTLPAPVGGVTSHPLLSELSWTLSGHIADGFGLRLAGWLDDAPLVVSVGTGANQVAAGDHTHSGYAAADHTHSGYQSASPNLDTLAAVAPGAVGLAVLAAAAQATARSAIGAIGTITWSWHVQGGTTSGTYVAPPGAVAVAEFLGGGGGGGGGGPRRDTPASCGGGGSGQAGEWLFTGVFDPSDLDGRPYTVGPGGAGGAGRTASTGNGSEGTAGTDTIGASGHVASGGSSGGPGSATGSAHGGGTTTAGAPSTTMPLAANRRSGGAVVPGKASGRGTPGSGTGTAGGQRGQDGNGFGGGTGASGAGTNAGGAGQPASAGGSVPGAAGGAGGTGGGASATPTDGGDGGDGGDPPETWLPGSGGGGGGGGASSGGAGGDGGASGRCAGGAGGGAGNLADGGNGADGGTGLAVYLTLCMSVS